MDTLRNSKHAWWLPEFIGREPCSRSRLVNGMPYWSWWKIIAFGLTNARSSMCLCLTGLYRFSAKMDGHCRYVLFSPTLLLVRIVQKILCCWSSLELEFCSVRQDTLKQCHFSWFRWSGILVVCIRECIRSTGIWACRQLKQSRNLNRTAQRP